VAGYRNGIATSRPPTTTSSTPPSRRSEWVVFAKRPFAGAQAILAYFGRYAHRVAISNFRIHFRTASMA
jgi:hypothetical protein